MRIGIIGAGQLGQMLGDAGKALGAECTFVDPAENPPAARSGNVVRTAFDDATALAKLAAECDVVTYEFENVPVDALRRIENRVPVYPPTTALAIAQDRLQEKKLFDELGIALPGYRAADSLDDLERAVSDLGTPVVVKTRRFGYDGKGQFVIRHPRQVAVAWQELRDQPLVVETFVEFDFEVSIIGVRNANGEIATWPLTRNEHTDGILRRSLSPVEDPALSDRATGNMVKMLEHLDYVGVLALELFVTGNDLLANEFAPRVHNSGHWTIEGAATSQFSNHLLAITGHSPGPTASTGHAGMVNLIGKMHQAAAEFADPRIYFHDYGKAPRAGRKLGHVTVVAESAAERDALLAQVGKSVTQRTQP